MTGHRAKDVPASEVARLYGLGLTMAEIASVYGVSEWTVASRLDHAGVRRRRASAGQAVLPLERAVASYRRQPDLLAELAEGLGLSARFIVGRAGRVPGGRRGLRRDRADVPAGEVAGLYRGGWTVHPRHLPGRHISPVPPQARLPPGARPARPTMNRALIPRPSASSASRSGCLR